MIMLLICFRSPQHAYCKCILESSTVVSKAVLRNSALNLAFGLHQSADSSDYS